MRIGMVAGESSGDILGASLIKSLKKTHPDLIVEGIGGPLMMAEDCESLFPMDRLSVMGLIEPLKRLPELLKIRKTLKKHFIKNPPDVFIGIDSPDFTLNIERALKKRGIKTVHYVSPSVWAWREGRIHKIKKAVDHMLCLFPFEREIYQQHKIPVTFVGHPLADQFAMNCDTEKYREQLKLSAQKKYVALLPGSRENEVQLLTPVFLKAARLCMHLVPDVEFLIPAANDARRKQLDELLEEMNSSGDEIPVTLFDGRSHEVMGASDAVLMASGTTTLEALLLKKPMVVSYKWASVSYAIISFLLKTPYVALPNLLANRLLVPELIQQNATAEALSQALVTALRDKKYIADLQESYQSIHKDLQCGAGDRAARAVLSLIKEAKEVKGAEACE